MGSDDSVQQPLLGRTCNSFHLGDKVRCRRDHVLFFEKTLTKTDHWTCTACNKFGEDNGACMASCRMCNYYLCYTCLEEKKCESEPRGQLLSECPWLGEPGNVEGGGLTAGDRSGSSVRRWSSARHWAESVVKQSEDEEKSIQVISDPEPFAHPPRHGPIWDAFRWLPKTMVPEKLEGPLCRWIEIWQEQTKEKNCHLTFGSNSTGPAILHARCANFILWGFYALSPIMTCFLSQCKGANHVVATPPLWLPVVFTPVLAISLRLEHECLKHVLATPHLIVVRRIKIPILSTSYHTSYRKWRIFALVMSIAAHSDIFLTGTVVATSIKASWECNSAIAEEKWAESMKDSAFFSVFGVMKMSTILVLSWLAVFCQVVLAFAVAQPLNSDFNVDFDYEVATTITFETLLMKNCSPYDALQIFAEAGRMYSVTCTNLEFEMCIMNREIRRIHSIASNCKSYFGGHQSPASYIQSYLGTCITLALFRCNNMLTKKVFIFLLTFVMESMVQLHLKITYMAIEKRVDSGEFSELLAVSTAFSMLLSLGSAYSFVNVAYRSYEKYSLFMKTIYHCKIDKNGKYYLWEAKREIHLDTQICKLKCHLAIVFIVVVLGLWLLVWAAAKLVMLHVCEGGMWDLSLPWNMEAGCVPRRSTMSNATLNATLEATFNM